jgi:hypothetical protein
MNQCSLHYDIETPFEQYYFKDLDWDITIPKLDTEIHKISIHNFYVFKDK